MHLHHSKQIQMDLEVEAKESADQWKATFDVAGRKHFDLNCWNFSSVFPFVAIETMTAKTGNFKSFSVFINMLENAINQVMRDLFSFLFFKFDI